MAWGAFRDRVRAHPTAFDAAFAVLFLVLFTMGAFFGRHPESSSVESDWTYFVAAATALVVLTLRRRWPERLLVLATAVSIGLTIAAGDRHPLLIIPWMVVAYTFVRRTGRGRAWLVAGSCVGVMYVAGGLFTPGGWSAPSNLGAAAWPIAIVAVADAARSRRAYITEVEERARRAEETREEEARRQVAEERLRIARELHDVVAHHIAVINVQAGAAAHVLKTRPEAVEPALGHIRRAADTVMKEMAAVVGVLRGPDELAPPTEPTRGLARLAELLDTFAAAGLQVEHRQVGEARELPAVVDLAAYRIVQESLTNAHKHGTGRARLTVTYGADAVVVDVRNPVAARGDGTGYGLVGMRERAAAAGGTVTAGLEPDGVFAVRATLPATAEESP